MNRRIAVPLGGIGAAGMSLSGSGRLIDWSIRNRPGLQSFNGYSHFAIKAEQDGELLDARVLNGPYEGLPTGSPTTRKFFDGFGWGANRNTLAGVPHFASTTFTGTFPVAEKAAATCVSLPIFPEMSAGQVDAVIRGVREFAAA